MRHAGTPEAHLGTAAGLHGSFVTGSTFYFLFFVKRKKEGMLSSSLENTYKEEKTVERRG